jgi:hypothetical protein
MTTDLMKKLVLVFAFSASSAQALDLAHVKELVGEKLKDPWSAHYRNVRESGPVICGEVNAKGGSGGYGGWLPFLIRDNKALVISEMDMNNDTTGAFYQGIAKSIRACTVTGKYVAPQD